MKAIVETVIKKRYRFINCATGYSIYYHTIKKSLSTEEVKRELEIIKAQVASRYGIMLSTIYWQEIKDDSLSGTLA